MSNTPIIECKPSKWFKIRAVLILLMLTFFTAWFFKDGHSGYREKNLEYVSQQLFAEKKEGQSDYIVNAIEVFKSKEFTSESWAEYASAQTLPTPNVERGLLPRDLDYSQKWPEELVNGYEALKEDRPDKLWKEYSARMKWSIDGPEKLYDEGKIREQFIVSGICLALTLFALFVILRIMGRNMKVTDTSYFAPGGKEVPFTSMRKIDKRKWDNKGLALIHYDDEGSMKKAKVDGMVYGHFNEEDGKPAEVLFDHILDNFKGELVEYVSDDEEDEAEDSSSETEDAETKE